MDTDDVALDYKRRVLAYFLDICGINPGYRDRRKNVVAMPSTGRSRSRSESTPAQAPQHAITNTSDQSSSNVISFYRYRRPKRNK